jgi:hypothetical protein
MEATHVSFEVDDQAAGTINNIGGDQRIQVGDGPSTYRTVASWVTAAGTAVVLAGLGFLIASIVQTVQAILPMPPWPESPYTQYVSALWVPAVILLGAGTVLVRLGRVFASR